MKVAMWLLALGALGVLGYALWSWRQRWLEHQRASEARLASFMAEARPVPQDPSLPQQRLLLEAAVKAGEAGEPVLSIQLYARLLARYPQSTLAAQARSAIETQKQRLAKATAPGTSGQG